MRSRKSRQLTAQEKRALASAGLITTRYAADGKRATVQQLSPEVPQRRQRANKSGEVIYSPFARRLIQDTKESEGA